MLTKLPSPAPRHDPTTQKVVRAIRSRIIAGQWGPGSQLPTWTDLGQNMQVGRTTLGRALGQLKREGFIFASSTRGMFVSDHLPHLTRYALAYRSEPGSPGWNKFWWTLNNLAIELSQSPQRTIESFYGVSNDPGSASAKSLLADAHAHRLAGVLFIGYPREISRELVALPGLAKAAICHLGVDANPFPHLYVDYGSFRDRALDRLAELGCRRVAVLTAATIAQQGYPEAAAKRGLLIKPQWQQSVVASDAQAARNIIHLLLDRTGDDRPDGLIIADDNLTAPALSGVVAAAVRVPDELQIVTHCSWPTQEAAMLPVHRLGFDARRMLEMALDLIDQQRRGEKRAGLQLLPARFEDELSLSNPVSQTDL